MAKEQRNWFLLRGLGRESGHWHDLVPILSAALPNDNFFCLDTPGAGKRWREDSPWLMSTVVDSLRHELTTLQEKHQLSANNYLFGLSLGAMIAVAWASCYRADFRGAVLVNTSLPRLNRNPFQRLRPQVLLSSIGVFFNKDLEQREKWLLDLVSNDQRVREQLLPSWFAIQKARPVSGLNYLRMLGQALTFIPPERSPFVRTLILKSTNDRLINSRCSDLIAERWQVPLREHTTAGHDLSSDDPRWVVKQLCDWLGRDNDSDH